MAIGVLELNDANLRLTDGSIHSSHSPGYASVSGNQLILGTAAMQQARLNPLQSNNQFWHRLSAEPLPIHNEQYRHHADLAYSHLVAVHSDFCAEHGNVDELVFSLPGNFTREQMALLLGIVEPCPFKAVGLVDSAVAASALYAQPGSCLHIDVQLHQCVFTLLNVDGNISRQQIEILPSAGLLALRDQFAKAVAEQFVDQSRFDPLHSASTEQSLYDQIPVWLAQSFDQTDMIVEVAGKTAKISRKELIDPLSNHYQQICSAASKMMGNSTQCIVGHLLATLPGFIDSLNSTCSQQLNSPVIALNENAVAEGVQQNIDTIVKTNGELAFVQSLPTSANSHSVQASAVNTSTSTDSHTDVSVETTATHVLVGHCAFALQSTPLFIIAESNKGQPTINVSKTASPETLGILQRQGESVSLLPQGKLALTCNNQAITDIIHLNSGDNIQADGIRGQLQFISVMET